MSTSKTLLFVCEHGALRSRIAAAYFNATPPSGWRARSAGREPKDSASPAADALLRGTPALDVLERDAPRAVPAGSERTIAIDCDEPADERWRLDHRDADAGMRDEIRDRVAALSERLKSAVTPPR